jgi:ribose transport system substrate-binding protein
MNLRRLRKMKLFRLIVGILLVVSFIGPVLAQERAFNPDAEPDRIMWNELEKVFGPVPQLSGRKLGAVEKTLFNEYWQLLAEGYKREAEKYGCIVDVQAAPNEADEVGQLAIAEAILVRGYDALLLSPITDSNLDPAVKRAKEMKVPVINVDDALIADADVYVGCSQKMNGVSAAEYIAEHVKSGKVAVITGPLSVWAARERTEGFVETIAKYPDLQLVANVPANWDRKMALDVATDIIQKHPDIKAFYVNNDIMAFGVVEAVKNAGKLGQIIVIGTDGIKEAYESIRRGELTGTIDSFPLKTGRIAVQVALYLLAGKKLPRIVETPQALITLENIDDYKDWHE